MTAKIAVGTTIITNDDLAQFGTDKAHIAPAGKCRDPTRDYLPMSDARWSRVSLFNPAVFSTAFIVHSASSSFRAE